MVPYRAASPQPHSPSNSPWPVRLTGVLLAVLLALLGGSAPSASALGNAAGASATASAPSQSESPSQTPSAGPDASVVIDAAQQPPHLQGVLSHPATPFAATHVAVPLLPSARQEHPTWRGYVLPPRPQVSAAHLAHHSPRHGRAPPLRTGI